MQKLDRVPAKNSGEDEALEYVAGFLDGEGSFSVRFRRKPYYRLGGYFIPIIIGGNSSKEAIEFVHKTLKRGYISYQWNKFKDTKRKLWIWKTEKAKDCWEVVKLLEDKLRIKRRQCLIVKRTAEILMKNRKKVQIQDALTLLNLYYSVNPNKFVELKKKTINYVLNQLKIKTFNPETFNCPSHKKPLNISYVAGFFDAEGSFIIRVKKSRTQRLGVQVYPIVAIGNLDREIIHDLHKFLGWGRVTYFGSGYKGKKKCWLLMIENLEGCKKFAQLLDGHLIAKRRDLELFKKALQILEEKRHLTTEGVLECIKIANELHPNRQLKAKVKRNSLVSVILSRSAF